MNGPICIEEGYGCRYPSTSWTDLAWAIIAAKPKKIIERLYACSSILNKQGQYAFYGRVGGCLITGNEDGIKHCAMNVLYSLQHLGYTIPPQADAGWIGEAGPGPSYGDDDGKAENWF